jgi:hypothetical protein
MTDAGPLMVVDSGDGLPDSSVEPDAYVEPDAGTDAANQQTTAVRRGNGHAGVYEIRGRKVWVANAEAAQIAIVFACTRPGLRAQGVTALAESSAEAGGKSESWRWRGCRSAASRRQRVRRGT